MNSAYYSLIGTQGHQKEQTMGLDHAHQWLEGKYSVNLRLRRGKDYKKSKENTPID